MLGIDLKAARYTWTVLLIVGLFVIAYLVRETILLFVISVLFAYLLAPLVDWVERFTPRRISKGISLAVVYLALVSLLVMLVSVVISSAIQQGATLLSNLPDLIQRIQDRTTMPLPEFLYPYRQEIAEWMDNWFKTHSGDLLGLVQRAGSGLLGLLRGLPYAIIVPIIAFFLLKDADRIRVGILRNVTDSAQRVTVDDILRDIHHMLAGFVRAIALMSLVTLLFYAAYFLIARVPYGILLATIAAVCEAIPLVGTWLAIGAVLGVSFFSGYPHMIALIIFLTAYRLFLDYVVSPYLYSSGVKISPLAVMFGVFAGQQLGGVWGMFLSVPIIAALQAVYVRMSDRSQP